MCAAQDAAALARSGTAAIERHQFGEALEAFTTAAALDPGDASLCFGAGVAAFMLGRNDVARARFERALALNPGYLQAAVWLGDLHYRAGRLQQAISVYEAARQRSPDGRQLQGQLAIWRKEQELESRFREVRTEHFTVVFEAAANEPIARGVVERLEAAHRRIGDALGVYPSEPVRVVLYTREQFDEITGLAAWSAAAYDGRIRIPISQALTHPDELGRVLSHELVHAVVAGLGGRTVPAWVSEGLATVLAPAGGETSDGGASFSVRQPALSELHRGFVRFSRQDAEIAYAASARAARLMIERWGAAAVVALLEDLARGVPFARAFHQQTAMTYEEFAALVAGAAASP